MTEEEERQILREVSAGEIGSETLTAVGKFTDKPIGDEACCQQLKDQCAVFMLSRVRECIEREAIALLQEKSLNAQEARDIINNKINRTMRSLIEGFKEFKPLQASISEDKSEYSHEEKRLMRFLQIADIAIAPYLNSNKLGIENIANDINQLADQAEQLETKGVASTPIAMQPSGDEKQNESRFALTNKKDNTLLTNINKALLKKANAEYQDILKHNALPEDMKLQQLHILMQRYARMQDFVKAILESKAEFGLTSGHSVNRRATSEWLNKKIETAILLLQNKDVDPMYVFVNIMSDLKGANKIVMQDHAAKQNVFARAFGTESTLAKNMSKVIQDYNEFQRSQESEPMLDMSWKSAVTAVRAFDQQKSHVNPAPKQAEPKKKTHIDTLSSGGQNFYKPKVETPASKKRMATGDPSPPTSPSGKRPR